MSTTSGTRVDQSEIDLSEKFYSPAKDAYVTWGEATELDHLSAATWIRSGRTDPQAS